MPMVIIGGSHVMPFLAHGFVDGKYFRKVCENASLPFLNPQHLVSYIMASTEVQSWSTPHFGARDIILARTTYYDGRPDNDSEVPAECVLIGRR